MRLIVVTLTPYLSASSRSESSDLLISMACEGVILLMCAMRPDLMFCLTFSRWLTDRR
jgi:hypothetical protein